MRKLWLVLLLGVFGFSGTGWAGDQDFKLVNLTGVSIVELYVSPNDTDEWEEDVLGIDVLPDEESVHIRFSRDEDACSWDLKIVDEDGDEVVWEGVNLCAISQVTLYWENGRAWAEVE